MIKERQGNKMKKTAAAVWALAVCGMLLSGCKSRRYPDIQAAEVKIISDKEYGEFSWPESEIASLIPKPEADFGRVEWETDYGFSVLIAEMTEKEFNEYTAECYRKGFNVNYRKGNDIFYADNKDGCHLTIKAQKDNVMCVKICITGLPLETLIK